MKITKVLELIRPGASWTVAGNTYEGMIWSDLVQTKPTLEEIEAAWPAIEAAAQKEAANAPIKAQLAALDMKRIRPLAEGDSAYLAKLNEQVKALRGQLK